MSDQEDTEDTKEAKISRSVVARWVEQLEDKGIIWLNKDDSMGIGFVSPLDRSVDTGPIDRLSIYWKESALPPILSIRRVDGKQMLVVSIDSNLIPRVIRSIQERSRVWIRRFRYVMWLLIITSGASFMIEVTFGISLPDYTALPRFAIFLISVLLYGIAGRIYLHGVAMGTPVSVYGCANCGEVIVRQEKTGSEGFRTCQECGGDLVPLMEGTPSSLSTQSKDFERMIHEELMKLKSD